jgi:hypothetical protein
MKIYRKRLWSYKSLREKKVSKINLRLEDPGKRAWREAWIFLVGRAVDK